MGIWEVGECKMNDDEPGPAAAAGSFFFNQSLAHFSKMYKRATTPQNSPVTHYSGGDPKEEFWMISVRDIAIFPLNAG